MLPSFLPLLLALCATKFVKSAIIQEDRTIAMAKNYHWESTMVLLNHDNKGSVPLYNAVIRPIHQTTCVDFRMVKPEEISVKNHIHFEWKPDNNCNSMEIKEQSCNCLRKLTIGKNCATTPKVLLNLLRGLGLHYQHKRSDRNQHIVLGPETGSWFDVLPNALYYDLPFDPLSIMHPVTVTREDLRFKDAASNFIAGKAKSLSFYDKKTINLMYNCDKNCPKNLLPCQNQGYRVQNLGCKCQCPKGFWGDRCEKHANSHHLHGIINKNQALELVKSVTDDIAAAFNPEIAKHAANVIKDTLIGVIPTALHKEEVGSRDVFATILGEHSLAKWGEEAVAKLGGNAQQRLKDVFKGNLKAIITTIRRNGDDVILGKALGSTLAVHFARSLGRGAVCVVRKAGHDIAGALDWVGTKLKDGFKTIVKTLDEGPGKFYDEITKALGWVGAEIKPIVQKVVTTTTEKPYRFYSMYVGMP